MIDTYDELRIIAKDGGRLDAIDRGIITRAADEIESLQKHLLLALQQLHECNARLIALTERLLEDKRAELAKPPSPPKLAIPGPLSMHLASIQGPMLVK